MMGTERGKEVTCKQSVHSRRKADGEGGARYVDSRRACKPGSWNQQQSVRFSSEESPDGSAKDRELKEQGNNRVQERNGNFSRGLTSEI